MIPTMILFGLVLGRWWKSAIVAGAALWPAILIPGGIVDGIDVLGAAALGAVNTAAGVAIHRLALWLIRSTRRDRPTPSPS